MESLLGDCGRLDQTRKIEILFYRGENFQVRIVSQWEMIYERATFRTKIFTEPFHTIEGWVRGIHITEDLKKNPEKNILNNTDSDRTLIMRNIEEAMHEMQEPFQWVMD